METDPHARELLIEFARSQMSRRGEIDTLIFTTKDIMTELKKASENLDKAVTDVGHAIHSIEGDAQNG